MTTNTFYIAFCYGDLSFLLSVILYGGIKKLKDLRSAVQKEACKLLSLSAETFQRSFEQAATKYISKDSLLSIINSGNKTLCENAHLCVQSIIEFCPSTNYLNPILEESQSKSQQVRSRASQFLVQVISAINPQQLDKFLPQLDAIIGKGVQDANPEVRLNFRTVFLLYRKIYPQKAERIFANFDSSIKKLLQEEDRNEQTSTQNQRLLQQKSLELTIGNSSSLASSSGNSKLQQSHSLNSDESQFHFASSAASGTNSIPRGQNKTPTQQQKQNYMISSSSSCSSNTANPSSSNTNNTNGNTISNKSRNVSAHLLVDNSNAAKSNLKYATDQLQNQKEIRKATPLNSREQAASPVKSMTQGTTPKLPLHPESLKQIKRPQAVQVEQNQRYNNFQDNQGRGNASPLLKEGQSEEHAGRKMQAYRSQDNYARRNDAEKNAKEEGEIVQRTNNSLNRVTQSVNTNGGEGNKMEGILQKRKSLAKESQQITKTVQIKAETVKQRGKTTYQEEDEEEEYHNQQGEIDDEDYELYRKRSCESSEEEGEENQKQDFDEQDQEGDMEQGYEQQQQQQQGNINKSEEQMKNKRQQENQQYSKESLQNKQGLRSNNMNTNNINNNLEDDQDHYTKYSTKSPTNYAKQQSSSSSQNAKTANNNTNNIRISDPKYPKPSNMLSSTPKMNNYVVNEQEDQQNSQQDEGSKKNGYLSRSKVQTANNTGKTPKQEKLQQNTKEEAAVNKETINPSASVSWRDDDLELLIEKAGNTSSWSTRASAFDSMKEVFGELASAAKDQSNLKGESERVNSQLIKKMVNSHIQHLSDSHFKVITACLDSFISLLAYDTASVLPHLDHLMFKVLNNLIDTKDVVSSKANFLVNILSKEFPGEKLIEPIQKVLEQTNKNLLKICSLEVLMVTVKGAEEYYQAVSNVRHTVQLMCMIIYENINQKQLALPSLGIILALRDHNPQATLHSILSLTNQNQISALRNLSYEFAQDLEEDLRKYVQKENIKPLDKITKSNIKSFQVEQSSYSMPLQQQNNTLQKNSLQQQQQQQSKSQVSLENNSSQPLKISQQPIPPSQRATGIAYDLNNLEDILSCVSAFEDNESYIIQKINQILLSTVNFFKQSSRKIKETALKVLSALFLRNYFYLTIQPHTVFECLSIYSFVPKDMDFYQVNEIIDEMIDCVPHLIFMKALVEKLNSEKPPQLQIMIKKISFILRKARKEEIRPFLDHIIDSFKISINDQSPDVRKSVVFCLVDLKFLMQEEVDPYFYQFTGNQQKLVEIYVKKRISPQEGGEEQPE